MEILSILLFLSGLAPVCASPVAPLDPQLEARGFVTGREPLDIGAPDDAGSPNADPDAGCTTTLTETLECSWDGTTTEYPSTTTLFRSIDCNGCDNVSVSREIHYCPNQSIIATLYPVSPSTTWSTVCQTSASVGVRSTAHAPAATTTVVPEHHAALPVIPTPTPAPLARKRSQH
ncbi:hypothetical protein B0J18DRAFT_70399 [Chaetomium sp. MPI-SDFR-AT-0129]|nr:hypothetical protein B0J18DRAFT_70399 [Chaetomium sp. MPI-SDFR-AT-0129]